MVCNRFMQIELQPRAANLGCERGRAGCVTNRWHHEVSQHVPRAFCTKKKGRCWGEVDRTRPCPVPTGTGGQLSSQGLPRPVGHPLLAALPPALRISLAAPHPEVLRCLPAARPSSVVFPDRGNPRDRTWQARKRMQGLFGLFQS